MALALIVVSIDLWFSSSTYQHPGWTRATLDCARTILAATALALYLLSGATNRRSLGLRTRPNQSLAYWIRFTVIVAALMLIPILAATAVAQWLNWEIAIQPIAPDQMVSEFVHMCLVAPVLEELIYRLVLCVPTTATIGSTGAIILSGATFAGLHFAYGNPGPDNFVAGYVLAWAYLKSGSIMVPIALHSLGNSVAFAVHVGAWYAA